MYCPCDGCYTLWWLWTCSSELRSPRAVQLVYGGLAAVDRLDIWMQLSAVIIFLGAAWNAELAESRRGTQAHA